MVLRGRRTSIGQCDRDRTCDFFRPREALYQTELHTDETWDGGTCSPAGPREARPLTIIPQHRPWSTACIIWHWWQASNPASPGSKRKCYAGRSTCYSLLLRRTHQTYSTALSLLFPRNACRASNPAGFYSLCVWYASGYSEALSRLFRLLSDWRWLSLSYANSRGLREGALRQYSVKLGDAGPKHPHWRLLRGHGATATSSRITRSHSTWAPIR